MEEVEVVDVPDFKMKQMIRFRITGKPDQVNSLSSLVATSTQFGLIFVGSNSKILVARVSELVEIDSSHVKKSQEVASFPHREILLPSSPAFISLSSDSLTLLVCLQKSNCPVAWLFDVRGFARQDGAWGPFQEVRLSPTDGVTVHDCAWNPTMPGLVAISLSDGSLLAVEVSGTQFTLNSLPSSTGAGVISWSPKGKQLVVARPGKLVQYKPDLKEAKTIPFTGGEVSMSQPNVVGLQWLSTVQFLVTFVDLADAGGRPHLFVVNSNKTGPPTFIDYDDICFGNSSDGRAPRFNSLTIPTWNILLVASANAMEVAVMAPKPNGSPDHPTWRQWILEGTNRAELPLDGDSEETRPLGMALDLSTQTQIPWADNQFLPPAPILFLLSTEGLLCPFQVINLLQPPAANINQPPQALTAAGERPALKISIPPLAASTPVGKSSSVARTNLDFSAIGKASVPPPQFSQPAAPPPPTQQVPPPQNSGQQLPPRQTFPPISQAAAIPPQPKPNPLPQISQMPKSVVDDQGGIGPAAQILQDEVAKFVQDLEAFKARSRNVKVNVATQEQKEKLIRMTAELSEFGTELVATTKTQDEEVRALYTELTEVAALLEDARVRHARRRNPRYGHLLKLRPLDPANRRKMDSIERLHLHIEQQLQEASRIMDSIGRSGPSNKDAQGSRKIEIPITQVIYEALKNNARVIMQLTNRLEKIKAQSNEQQLKLAGAAFEALRIKDNEPKSQNWDSELAVLADSLLSSRMDSSSRREEIAAAFSPTPSSVLPQVSPEKQALLRNVLSTRPVTRIRAIRPETASESRLLSNLSSIMSCSSSNNNSQPEESSVAAVKPSPKPAQSVPTPLGKTSSILLPEIEDISPPSTPINTTQLDLAAKSLTGQKLVSGFALIPRTTASITSKPIAAAVPASSAPPPAYSSSAASVAPKPAVVSSSAAPAGLIGTPSGKTSAFSSTPTSSISGFGTPSGMSSAFSSSATPTSSSAGFGSLSGSLSSAFSGLPASSAFSSAFSATPSTTSSVGSFFGAKAATPSAPSPAFSITPVVSKPAAMTPTAPVVTSTSAPAVSAPPVATTPASTTSTIIPKMSSLFGTPATTAPSTPVVTTSAAVSASLPVKPAAESSSFGFSPAVTSSTATPTAPSSSFSFALPQAAVPASTSAPAPLAAATSAGLNSTPAQSAAATTAGLSSTPAASPASSAFSLSLAGNKTAPAASTAPLFSLNASSKPPTAFGVVPASGGLFGQSAAIGASSVFGQPAAPTVTSTTTSSLFGQSPAVTSSSVFGQAPAATTSSVFGQPAAVTTTSVFGQPAAVTTTSVFGQAPAVTTSSVFGQPAAVTTSSTSLFGQPAVTNAGLTSLFGQASTANPISSAPTAAFGSAPLFGRPAASTAATPAFGAASTGGASTAASPFGASSAFGGSTGGGLFGQPVSSPAFGQPAAFGAAVSSSTSVFGQPTGGSGNVLGSSSSSSTGFGVSAPIGQSVFGGTTFGQPASSGSTSAFGGSSMFGGMGLGGTPNAANANRNVFGGGSTFGASGSSAFGAASPGPSPAPSAFASPSFGQQSSSGFGQPPAFGSSPAFGGAPAFGGPATFGGSPNPMFGGKPTFGSPAAAAPLSPPKVETGGFGAFAAASGPSFGALAANNPQQPAFGGAAFQSPPPAFGGGSSFSSWRS